MHLRPHAPPNHGADPKPTPNQVAFADRILLNKTDLVEESELCVGWAERSRHVKVEL